jgi:hypothetical protein
VDAFLRAGADPSKLFVGAAFYGRGFHVPKNSTTPVVRNIGGGFRALKHHSFCVDFDFFGLLRLRSQESVVVGPAPQAATWARAMEAAMEVQLLPADEPGQPADAKPMHSFLMFLKDNPGALLSSLRTGVGERGQVYGPFARLRPRRCPQGAGLGVRGGALDETVRLPLGLCC